MRHALILIAGGKNVNSNNIHTQESLLLHIPIGAARVKDKVGFYGRKIVFRDLPLKHAFTIDQFHGLGVLPIADEGS